MPLPPDLDEVLEYLKLAGKDRDAEVTSALAAEVAAQRRVVRARAFGVDPVPGLPSTPYPADLSEALKRRVARNLALRGVPLAVLQSDSEAGPAILPGRDPEVRRLEAPYKKLIVG
jgi:hypothetical protein